MRGTRSAAEKVLWSVKRNSAYAPSGTTPMWEGGEKVIMIKMREVGDEKFDEIVTDQKTCTSPQGRKGGARVLAHLVVVVLRAGRM